jgi:peroxiredoxin
LPSVDKLYQEFKAKGLAVYLVDFRESAEAVKRTVRERGYTAPVLLDESGEVTGKAYGVWAPPTFYFVDREGRLVGRAIGPRNWDRPAAREFIQALLDLGAKP